MRRANSEPAIEDAGLRFRPETRACLDLLYTHGHLTTGSAEIFREHGVTPQQFYTLRALAQEGPEGAPVMELGTRLPTPAPDVSRLIERLRRAGLVERRRLESDRRIAMVRLSERGERLLERIEPAVEAVHRQRLAHMSRDELERLSELLRKARAAPRVG